MENKITTISLPQGFLVTGFASGIKNSGLDTALFSSRTPAKYAGLFTTNKVRAACIDWNKSILAAEIPVKTIIANSGNANACTGKQGVLDTEKTAETVADTMGFENRQILVASTGVIGVPLPITMLQKGISHGCDELGDSPKHIEKAAKAILTTDTVSKTAMVRFLLGDTLITISGFAKGSGMIHPDMATMLGFILTDAVISQKALQAALRKCTDETFNMISVDGDTSTNDMVLVLANGSAGNSSIDELPHKKNNNRESDFQQFKKALYTVCESLAKQIAKDGEGATKFLEVQVTGAGSKTDAKKIAKAIISSNLVKTAFFGQDANWGRILAAAGYSGAAFNPQKVTITIVSGPNSLQLMEQGTPVSFSEEKALHILREHNITILFTLADGKEDAKAWGCDLSYEYVKINGDYRT